MFSVGVADKGLSVVVSGLESTVAGGRASVDSKLSPNGQESKNLTSIRLLTKRWNRWNRRGGRTVLGQNFG